MGGDVGVSDSCSIDYGGDMDGDDTVSDGDMGGDDLLVMG